MANLIPTVLKKFYDQWNIQSFIMLSFYLQIILVLFSPFRKRSRNPIIIGLIWYSYVLADWVASFSVGLISRRQSDFPKSDDVRVDILAVWVSFLVLHLGGPDNITAFSLEDNTLWLRQLVGLISQVLSAFIVFGESLPENKLWIPTALVFVSGTIKYSERIRALYSANINTYQEQMIEKSDEIMKRVNRKINVQVSPVLEFQRYLGLQEILEERNVVLFAFCLLEMSKGLIADVIPRDLKRKDSWHSFFLMNSTEAFRILEVELHLLYEVFYTKGVVLHTKLGLVVRFISCCTVMAALSTFYLIDKHDLRKLDVGVTYTLFLGAVCLDAMALFMLVTSDWTNGYLESMSYRTRNSVVMNWIVVMNRRIMSLKEVTWCTNSESKGNNSGHCVKKFLCWCFDWVRGMLFQRSSCTIHTFNFIDYCLKECPERNCTVLGRLTRPISKINCARELYDSVKHVSKKPVGGELWKFIFTVVKAKASNLPKEDADWRTKFSTRFDNVLRVNDLNDACQKLLPFVVDVDYYQSLLLWHIATDLLYQTESVDVQGSDCCKWCKILSDYMLYLLIMQPTMMSAVSGMVKIRFRDTCWEAMEVFKAIPKTDRYAVDREAACKEIHLRFEGLHHPTMAPTKFAFENAYLLFKELENLQFKWELISDVWMELLLYAAAHCRANMHVTQLSKGGELITFVWLLMAHLNIGDNFQSSDAIAMIIVKHLQGLPI